MLPWLAVLAVLMLTGCAGPGVPPASSDPAAAVMPTVSSPPSWRPGDRWVYGWSSGAESGTKTVEALEIREINGVSFYLVRVGDVESFYTRDLRWAGTMQDGE